MKILVATEKPFAKVAVDGIRKEVEAAGMELALLEKYTEKAQLLDAVATADALIIRSDKVDAETAAGVCVMNTPGQNSNAVAELVFGLLVYAVRNFYNGTSGTELKGKKLGIHAYGNVGRNVARIARGFGMEIYAYDAYAPAEVMEKDGVKPLASVEELYATADVVSVHIPATAETRQSINEALLARLPKGAVVVNTARKEVIDEPALVRFLEARPDVKYVTDIRPDNHEEMTEKFAARYFATPKKMGAQTAEANINAGIAAARQIVGYLLHGDEKFRVNK